MGFFGGSPILQYIDRTAGKYRNVVLSTVGAGIILFGSIYSFGNFPSAPGRTEQDIAASFVAKELCTDCAQTGSGTVTGSGVQVIAGATTDGSIFTTSGAFIGGPLGNPAFVASHTGAILKGVWQGTAISSAYITGVLSESSADSRYVNTSGDTMTGALIINPTTPTAKGDLEVIGTISGATLQDGGNQVSALKCANFDVSGTGSNLLVSTGTNVAFSFPAFSGSIISVKAIHQTLGDGLTTYDVNINNVTVLSTKLTIDASESCSQAFGGCTDVAAAAAVISTNSFNQYAKISVDVDSVAGNTIPAKGVVNVCTLPDFDGYAPF